MIFYSILSVLCILLLTVNQKDYWKSKQFIKLQLKKEVVIILFCIGFSYTSIALHQAKETRHTPIEIGELNNEDIKQLNFLDRSNRGKWNVEAKDRGRIIKNIAIYIIPISLLLFSGSIKERFILFVVFTQGYVLTESLTGIAKGLVDRLRPFASISQEMVEKLSFKSKEELREDFTNYDIQNSFFSGDASITTFGFIFFALSFALFYPQSRFKKMIWVLACIATLLVCYFRVQSGKHFPTDVFVGALVGGLIAWLALKVHTNLSSPN